MAVLVSEGCTSESTMKILPYILSTVLMHSGAALAEVYLSQTEALALVCGPGHAPRYDPKEISPQLQEILEQEGVEAEPESKVANFFVCQDDKIPTGYALIDQEVGKHLPITYVVGISTKGEVSRVEIMVFREIRGWEVREKKFLNQFQGKKVSDDLAIGRALANVTGATLSARSLSKGTRRALLLWQKFYGDTSV